MATPDKRLKNLYEALRETQAKQYEITEEIGRVLNGEKGIGDIMKALRVDLSTIWEVRYHSPYVWQAKDSTPVKKLLKDLQSDEIKARWQTYVKNNETYYVQARHGFALFASQINRFAGLSEPVGFELEVDAPADCKHSPRCKTDQAHTRKRSAELRA